MPSCRSFRTAVPEGCAAGVGHPSCVGLLVGRSGWALPENIEHGQVYQYCSSGISHVLLLHQDLG